MNRFDLEKINAFAALVKKERGEQMTADGYTYDFSQQIEPNVKPGKKYCKVDIGSSGAFMITKDGEIFGIKAYGVINRARYYGTLNTIDEIYWGHYQPCVKT